MTSRSAASPTCMISWKNRIKRSGLSGRKTQKGPAAYCCGKSSFYAILLFRCCILHLLYSKIVCPSTSVVRARSPFIISFLRRAFSSSAGSAGLPSGCGIAIAGTIRFAPTVMDIGVTVQIWTTGRPALSISFTIVAPQRVQVPHVLVSITPSTPADTNFFAYSAANAFADATAVPLPTVV